MGYIETEIVTVKRDVYRGRGQALGLPRLSLYNSEPTQPPCEVGTRLESGSDRLKGIQCKVRYSTTKTSLASKSRQL